MRKFKHTLFTVAINTFLVALSTLAFGGILFTIIMLLTNHSAFANASFGIYG